MRLSLVLAAGAAAVALAAVTPASATVMIATLYGATDSGWDYAGLFGSRGSLAYKALTVSFTYDTALAPVIASGGETTFGGPFYGDGSISPLLSATVTINDASQTFALGYRGFAASLTGFWTSLTGEQATPGNFASSFSATFYHNAPGQLTAPVADWGDGNGGFTLYAPNHSGSLRAEADFSLDRLEITVSPHQPSPASAAPEPAAWALLIAGFGLAGGALRARRRLAPA